MGAGARVHLKFDPNVRLRGAKQGIGSAGFFPGAIVALRGKNGGGGWFTVTEVLSVSNKVLQSYIYTDTGHSYLRYLSPVRMQQRHLHSLFRLLAGRSRRTQI